MSLESFELTSFSDRFDIGADAVVTLTGPTEALALSTTSLVGIMATLDEPLLILSTGLAADVIGPNVEDAPGTDLGIEGGINDDIILTLDLTKPESANNFRFDFTFLSNEFPDFQPDDFNDFFSVAVNGVTVPGGAIDINSAFFDPDLSTEGTQFNGRTDNLRATIPLDVDLDDVVITLRIADEGDGRIDSAAIINNFAFTNNTVFVDFGESDVTIDTLLFDDLTFTSPAADLTILEQDQVLAFLNDVYSDFNVTFTRVQPDFPEFSTIHVGGDIDSVPDAITPSEVIFSRSEAIDTGNENPADSGFVLSEEANEATTGANKVDLIAQAVAREAGHLFGLRNVADRDSVLFPTPGESRDEIGTPSNLAALADDGGITTFPFIQDIPLELENNLGLPNPSIVPIAALTGDLAKVLTVEIGHDAPTLFEARIAAIDPDDNILELAELGDLGPQDIAHFFAPVMDEDRIVLIAKSAAGGDFDLFLAPEGLEAFSFDGLSEREVIDALGVRAADYANGVYSILGDAASGLAAPVHALTGLAAAPEVLGDRLANSLIAGDGGEALLGFGDNDTLNGGAGADQIFGGDGEDSLLGAGGDDDIRGGDGADVLDGGDGNDNLSGGAGVDSLRGGAGDDTLVAELGEAIEGGDGDDTARISATFEGAVITDTGDGFLFTTADGVIEATGVETFIFEDQTVSVDTVNNMVNPAELLFDLSGGDALIADDVADTVRGGAGDDTISGSTGADLLLGETGGDRLVGFSGADTLDGGEGRDILEGGAGDDLLLGGAEGDQLTGGDGVDELQGGDGADTLDGGDDADRMQGGGGADVVMGGEGDDRLEGDAGDDTLEGGAGEDVAIGGQGADRMTGGAGGDRLIGGSENDTILGGGGEDTLRGGQGADELLGGLGEDRLRSGGGNDALNGGGGADNARAGGGADKVRGGGGGDDLHGGGGADVINGGRGDDALRGGIGADIFEFRTNDGDDTIRDFQQGLDRIKILRGAEEFSDLDIDQVGPDVVISFANVTITVERQDRDNFTEADFIF